jgi:cytochrome bd-type quinol oxidase subunit 2
MQHTRDRDAEEATHPEDGLVENYRTILNELALLTTVSVLLFGFLLTSANSFAESTVEEVLYSVAIVLVATATLVFVLPVAYHHLQFPYHDFEKFTERTHGWTMLGLPLLGVSLYLSLSLAIWSLLDAWALAISALPLLAVFVAFLVRRELSNGMG